MCIDNSDNNVVFCAGTTRMMLASFSLPANWRRLVSVGSSSPGALTSLDGLRMISTLWVVLGHKGMYSLQSPLVNKSIVVEVHILF